MSQSLSVAEVNGLSWSTLHLQEKWWKPTPAFQAVCAYTQLS